MYQKVLIDKRKKTPEEKAAYALISAEKARARSTRNRAKKRARHKEKMANDPVFRAHILARDRATYERNKKAIISRMMAKANTPEGIILRRLRRSVKRHVLNAMAETKHRHTEGGRFLAWLAAKIGIQELSKSWHIDHLIPIKSFDLSQPNAKATINAPENVRWLTSEQNLLKGSKMPSVEEMAEHLSIVREWRASL